MTARFLFFSFLIFERVLRKKVHHEKTLMREKAHCSEKVH